MSYPPQPPQAPQAPQQPPQYPPQYQQGQYPQGQYQQPYGQYQAVQPKTNTLALVGFIMSLVLIVLMWFTSWFGLLANLAAFILCIIGNSQIKASAGTQTGKGFAVAGIVITSILFGLFVLGFIVIVGLGLSILGGMGML
ncbi:MAG: hypothetical protein K0R39_1607 [Symbiobacteriaceae bacterium]|nr:hypothetical protein [Symbiobacteriaceae bacterium]